MPKAVQSKVLSRFPVEHAIAYGLKVLEQSPATGEVVSVQCQFCVYFSVEEGSEPRQRAKKETKRHGQTTDVQTYIKDIIDQSIHRSG